MVKKSPRQVTVTVSAEIYAALDKLAARRSQNVAKYLTEFLDEYGRDEWIDNYSDFDSDFEVPGRPKRQYPLHAVVSDVPVRRHVRKRRA